jgi:membrane protease subunit (stomatin/prohibitin family)
MGIFNTLRNELIDIIEWIDDGKHTLVWRFPRYENEIKNGARLIVRPGQSAVFVREGQIADVFGPGSYELTTKNLPLLSTLAGWKYGFDSPFKAEVYFVSTRTLTDLKWGTPNPVMLRDADFGPIRLRAFGNFTLRAIDSKALLRELVGTDGIFAVEAVAELLRAIIASSFADVIGEAQLAALDLASKYNELSELLKKRVCERIDDEYGLEVPALQIINIALPESVEKALDKRS